MYGIHDQAIDLLHHSYNTHIYITIKKQDCFADKLSDVEQWRNYGGGTRNICMKYFPPVAPHMRFPKHIYFICLIIKYYFVDKQTIF